MRSKKHNDVGRVVTPLLFLLCAYRSSSMQVVNLLATSTDQPATAATEKIYIEDVRYPPAPPETVF